MATTYDRKCAATISWILCFYHRFIDNLSRLAAPLYGLLKKDTPFMWSSQAKEAFEKLKKVIITLPTLAFPDPRKPYDVHTDASTYGLGAVLVQGGRPIAFTSRTLKPAEKNYSTTDESPTRGPSSCPCNKTTTTDTSAAGGSTNHHQTPDNLETTSRQWPKDP